MSGHITSGRARKSNVSAADFSMVNQPGAGSYPIIGYSWALMFQTQSNAAKARALEQLMQWTATTGQQYAARLDYVPLPPNIRSLASTKVSAVKIK